MKNILKLFAVLVLLSPIESFSQGQSWYWYFGWHAGVNFPNGGPPVAVTNGQINTLEGVATISDPAGNLLFYTDGSTVWNKLHAVMANGTGLLGNGSSTQSGVIIPKPGSSTIYYVFTVALYNGGLRYSEVDMTLAAGNGSVTVKNTFLYQNNSEKCCAVRHCNGTDIWVISHDGTNQFKSYLVTAAGVNMTPTVTTVGSNNPNPGIGYLKASLDGNKLAYAVYINGFLEILDFNKTNGVVSNPITIPGANYNSEYGVEFSPDNTKVYFGSYSTDKITQVNLCAGSNAAIIASATDIGTSVNSVGALQIGPDHKIYVARSGAPWLGVINSPNTLGAGCGYVDAGVSLNGKNCGAGLPNFISSYFLPPPPPFTSTVNCLNVGFTSPTVNITNCNTSSNAITSYSWNFGDAASGPANLSALANPSHSYSGPGTFTVQLILGYACGQDTLSQPVTVISCSPMVSVNSPSLCSGNCAALTATANGGTPPYTYTWTPNIGAGAGPHNVCPNTTTIYSISITDANNVIVSNAATVLVVPTPTLIVTPSSPTLCMNNFNGSTNTISISANGASTYSWTGISGLTTNTTAGAFVTATSVPASLTGTGTVIGTIGSCTSSVDFTVAALPNPTISVSSASMCFGTSATLSATGADSYVWTPAASLNSSTGSSVIAVPSTTTVYSIIGASLNCMSTTETATVDVVANPTVVITSASPTICAGTNIMLTVNGATTYTWSPGGSLNNTNGPNVVASPWVNTTYSVIGTLNTCTASTTQEVVVIPLPTLQAMCEKTLICAGEKTSINANGASSYTWTPSLGISDPNSNYITLYPSSSTNYVLIGNNGICTATLGVPITVIPNPIFNLSTSNQKICFGNNTTLFASGAQNYNWSPTYSVNILNQNTAIVTPSITTNYTVTGYNFSGSVTCSVTKEIEIEVVSQVTASISNSVSICAGESVKLQAGGSNSYLWMPSAGLNNTSIAQPYASSSVTTIYTVQVSNGGYCGTTATVLVVVNPLPDVDAGPDVTFNLDEAMYLNAKGTGTLTWIFGEGIICKDCPNTQIMAKNSECYQIQAVNSAGCKAIDEVCIDVTKDYNIYIPNIFTPNHDGLNDVFLVYGTGLNKFEMYIYDRWGEKLFVSADQLKGWDGTVKGVDAKEDAYTYMIIFTALDGKKYTKTGHVTLMK